MAILYFRVSIFINWSSFLKNELHILPTSLYYSIITQVWNHGYLFCSLTYSSVLPVINSIMLKLFPLWSLWILSGQLLCPFDIPQFFVFLLTFPYPFATSLFSIMLFGDIKFPFFSFYESRQSNNFPPGNGYWFKDEYVTQFCPIHGNGMWTSVRFSEENFSLPLKMSYEYILCENTTNICPIRKQHHGHPK